MHPFFEHQLNQTRRQFFGSAALNFGGVAMGMLAAQSGFTESNSFAAAPSSPIVAVPLSVPLSLTHSPVKQTMTGLSGEPI